LYYNLVQSLKRRLILELKDSFSNHPVYRKIVPFIQNRFSFEERPQFGIVIKGSSANKVALAADNFMGTIQSHVMLAYVGQPSFPLEWVREDLRSIAIHKGMPTPPGVYLMEILTAPTTPGEQGDFVIDPLYTVVDEPVLVFTGGTLQEAQLQHVPLKNTLRMWADSNFPLKEGVDYTVDYTSGALQMILPFPSGSTLSAQYRWAGESIGPVKYSWNTADFTTLPGVVLAFGKRAEAGHKVAVVVYTDRVDTAQAFGGKFEVSFDLDVIARDPIQMEELSDLLMMYLLAQKKPVLELEGIEILDVSMSGEAEEIADETGEEFFFQASLSIQMRADWEIHVPLPLTISKVTPIGDPTKPSLIQAVASEIFFQTHPIFEGRNDDYERIA